MSITGINLWAVLVSAVAAFMAGGVWYGAIFSKAWPTANRHSEAALAEMAKLQGRNFALFFVGDLVMATILAVLVVNLNITSAMNGAVLGLTLWMGVALPIKSANDLANNKTLAAFLIDTGYELAMLLLVGAILGAWR